MIRTTPCRWSLGVTSTRTMPLTTDSEEAVAASRASDRGQHLPQSVFQRVFGFEGIVGSRGIQFGDERVALFGEGDDGVLAVFALINVRGDFLEPGGFKFSRYKLGQVGLGDAGSGVHDATSCGQWLSAVAKTELAKLACVPSIDTTERLDSHDQSKSANSSRSRCRTRERAL